MKSERRHHLQQNELAGHLGKARHWIEPYTVPLLAGVVVIILGVLVFGFFRSRSDNQRSDATLGLLLSTAQEDAEAYNLVSTDFAGTPPAVIASLAKADAFLREGIEAMYTDRELSKSRLEDAEAAYREVIDETKTTLLKSRAYYGLAQTLETQGNLEAAIEAYQQVIQVHESEAMVQVAEDRIAALERPGTQEFVSWFAEQKPTAFDPGAPPGMPDASSLPEMPDFTLPGLNPSAVTPPANPADATSEAADDDPAATEQLAAESPVTEEPVTEEPLTEEPLTEEPVTEEPTAEEPAVEEPAVEEGSTEEAEGEQTDDEAGDDASTDSAENVQP